VYLTGHARRNVEWEGTDVWFAHCCMLDAAETAQFADKGIGIAHCPSSNMRLASGEDLPFLCTDVPMALDA
jgi:cytosine/adenosine deaminase-related metal-dependent hydrolase